MAIPELLSRGRSAEVYNWGDDKVLKLFYEGHSADQVISEAKVTDSVFRAGLPVPEVFETTDWKNRFGIVFEKIDGISMLDACIENPQNAGKYGKILANIHHKIHDTSIEALPDLIPSLVQKVRSTNNLSADQKQKVVNLLENQADHFKLCHMDFHPDQVLISENRSCVIDWETACQGVPFADIARTLLILRIGESPRQTSISNRELDKIRNSLIANYLDQYFISSTRESSQTMVAWELVAAITRQAEAIGGEERKLKQIIEDKIEVYDAM